MIAFLQVRGATLPLRPMTVLIGDEQVDMLGLAADVRRALQAREAPVRLDRGFCSGGVTVVPHLEFGVHFRRLRDLVAEADGAADPPGQDMPTQIIATTYSPYLLDHVPPDNVVWVREYVDGDCDFVSLADIKPQLLENGWKPNHEGVISLGEMWSSDLIRMLVDQASPPRDGAKP